MSAINCDCHPTAMCNDRCSQAAMLISQHACSKIMPCAESADPNTKHSHTVCGDWHHYARPDGDRIHLHRMESLADISNVPG